jgi:hypothetical protein
MEIMLAGLGVVLIIVFVVPLAVLRAGIRQQERAACLTCQPPGLCAALARRLLGLYAQLPGDADQYGESPLVPDGKDAWPS